MGTLPTAESLPAPLVTREQWVAWRTEERSGKQTKIPVNPATGAYASATDAETWTNFATAREYATSSANGVGFVFTDADPIVGIDLDDCRDPDDGALTDWARDIIDRLDSFTEVSPSGTGVHVLVEGELPDGRNRHGDVELYDDARFFTVTGEQLTATPDTIEPRQEALAAVHAEYVMPDDASGGPDGESDTEAAVNASERSASTPGGVTGPRNELGDEELLSRARSAANGEKFSQLFNGQTADYPSQSEADMALCSLLAFWTGGDPEQMDRLFRESGLLRPKWDEEHFADGATYGERTIERAIAGTDEFYTAPADAGEGTVSSRTGSVRESAPLDGTVGDCESDDATVSVDIVTELEAELQQLQSEKEALQAELATEREQREALEAELEELRGDSSNGWLGRLRWW